MAAFARSHPGIFLSSDITYSLELPGAIAQGHGHLGMIDANFTHAGVVAEPFLDTEAICLMPEGHPLTATDRVTPADLDCMDYVAINRRHAMRGRLDDIFSEHHVSPRIVIETDVAMQAADFVRAGLGVTVVNPFPILLGKMAGLTVRSFDPPLHFHAYIVLPANLPQSAVAKQFLDFLKERRATTIVPAFRDLRAGRVMPARR